VRAGANLLQVYSALVFRGLALVGEVKEALLGALERREAKTLVDLVGIDAADITAQTWPA
jgi:dihydroorotate dehydrogenase